MQVFIAIPSHSGVLQSECVLSLMAAQHLLEKKGIEIAVSILNGCGCIPVARNTLVAQFMQTEATDFFFIDDDVGFDASAVLKLLERPEKIVAGVYPFKRDGLGFPVKVKTEDGIPIGRDGLVEAELLPTGFMRIKRTVFERMQKSYPELKYKPGVVDMAENGIEEAYDFFNMGEWRTEDYAFCKRWTDIEGQLWVYPDIDFSHVGRKEYKGNYYQALAKGAETLNKIKNLDAVEEGIKGWMSPPELETLRELASEAENIVEIGCWKGRSTKVLLESCKGDVFAVDHFLGSLHDFSMLAAFGHDIYDEFMRNVGEYRNLHVLKGNSVKVANDFNGRDVDLVFIDAGHSYEECKSDIDAWMPKCSGVIAGHDYGVFDGVTKAVDEVFKGKPIEIRDSIWIHEL